MLPPQSCAPYHGRTGVLPRVLSARLTGLSRSLFFATLAPREPQEGMQLVRGTGRCAGPLGKAGCATEKRSAADGPMLAP